MKYYLEWRQACWLYKDIVILDVCGRLKRKGGLFKLEISKYPTNSKEADQKEKEREKDHIT